MLIYRKKNAWVASRAIFMEKKQAREGDVNWYVEREEDCR